jgi:hypothetical protein
MHNLLGKDDTPRLQLGCTVQSHTAPVGSTKHRRITATRTRDLRTVQFRNTHQGLRRGIALVTGRTRDLLLANAWVPKVSIGVVGPNAVSGISNQAKDIVNSVNTIRATSGIDIKDTQGREGGKVWEERVRKEDSRAEPRGPQR